jgi:hypothetical protein
MTEYWKTKCISHHSIIPFLFASLTSVLSVISVVKKVFLLKDYRKPRGVSIQPATLPPSLWRFPFLLKIKLVARKQGRCAQKASAGKEFAPEIPPCFRRERRAYRAPGRAPLQRNYPVLGKRMACPPGPRNEARLMVFARNALASEPGNA